MKADFIGAVSRAVRKHQTALLASTVLAGLAPGLPALAQGAADTRRSDISTLEEVVVTARRVEENLQTTPVAVTALTGEALQRSQVVDVQDLQRTAPGLLVAQGAPGLGTVALVSIRGQGQIAPIIANDPAVAIYQDGVYIPRPSQGLMDMHDIQRAEVLRGPQGTLFGRNTTGGAINIVTNDPIHEFTGSARAELGDFDFRNFGAVLNVPITEKLAGRFVYNFRERDGLIDAPVLGRDVGSLRSHFLRAKVKYEEDSWDLTLSGDYNIYKDNGSVSTLSGVNSLVFQGPLAGFLPATAGALHRSSAWWTTFAGGVIPPLTNPLYAQLPADVQAMHNRTPYNELETYGFAATVNIDLGWADFKSISGYRYSANRGLTDTDATPAPILATYAGEDSKQYSQEVQLSGDLTERLSYITGGYYSKETGDTIARSQTFGGLIRDNFALGRNIARGVYAQLYYDLTETLRAAAGYRYTWDTREVDIRNRSIFGLPPQQVIGAPSATATGFNCSNTNVIAGVDSLGRLVGDPAAAARCSQLQEVDFRYPAWTAGLDWQASEGLFLYVKTSGAAKAGGWNTRAGALPSFRPEKVKDVEAGVKADLFDRRLRLNAAAFYSWKTDIQATVNAFVPVIGLTQFTQNNGDARIWGAEFEAMAAPWKGMEITANVALTEGEYESGSFTEVQRIAGFTGALPAGCSSAAGQPATTIDCVVDLSNTPLPQLPKVQYSIGATQTVRLGPGEAAFHLDYAYVGSQVFLAAAAAAAQSPVQKQLVAEENRLNKTKGYGVLNGRVGYTLDAPNVEFYAFGRNLLEEKYLTRRVSDFYRSLGVAIEYPGHPRTVGVGVNYRF